VTWYVSLSLLSLLSISSVYILQRDMAHNFYTKRVGMEKFCLIGLCHQNFGDEIWIPIGRKVGIAVISSSSVKGIIHGAPTGRHTVFPRRRHKTFIEPKE
jgi:hypothetical protein